MKRSIFLSSILMVGIVLLVSACGKSESDAEVFKTEYESLNGLSNNNGNVYRTVSIDSDNPFVYITTEELIEKINNGETLYVYFGSKYCPWCRSVIESAISVAKDEGIETIYYIDIWDDDKNEILRDKYTINDEDEIELVTEGTTDYYTLLELFDAVLEDYTLTTSERETISVGEKRIYAPNFIYIEDGSALNMVEGISELQEGSYDDLTEEIISSQEAIFKEFFKTST